MEKKELIYNFALKRFPQMAIYGYGSGVFKQSGYTFSDLKKTQIDLFFIVHDLKMWHLENIKRMPTDYSATGKTFFTIGNEQLLKGETGITYQSNILEDNHIFKYGVIEYNDFVNYLSTWHSFFVPGRFHKPILKVKSYYKLDDLIEKNRKNALVTVLLMLMNKDNVTELDIYNKITELSFIGDIRRFIAENPHKITNITSANLDFFKENYRDDSLYTVIDGKVIINKEALFMAIDDLPQDLLVFIKENIKNNAFRENILEKFFYHKNRWESIEQPLKGIATNGLLKSAIYVKEKVRKRFKGR